MQGEIDQMDNFVSVGNVECVLMIPHILDEVLSHLDFTTLKSARLVCTDWADVGAKFLGEKGRLAFSTPTDPFEPNCEELASFNHNLAKNITLHMKCYFPCDCDFSPTAHRNLPSNFAILLPQICGKLDTLNFNIESTCNPRVHKMWSTYQFPNLTQLSISVTIVDQLDLDGHIYAVQMTQFRPLEHLKVFSFKILPDDGQYFPVVVFSPLCQNLLNAAPNLEEFDIKANFYPDLTPCRKLKELKFKYCECRKFVTVQVDIREMMRMLKTCSDSLEKLTLECDPHYHSYAIQPIKLNLNFPNLTHLSVGEVKVYKIEDSVNTTNLPKLTHFSINHWDHISGMIAPYQLCHPGITSLKVGCTHRAEIDSQDGRATRKLVNLFPGVKEFELKLRIIVVHFVTGEFLHLKEMIQSLSDWDLTSGHAVIKKIVRLWPLSLDEELDEIAIITVLGGMTGWKGLKNTSLRFNGCDARKFSISDGMRAALVACRTIRNVAMEGFQIDDETLEDFREFIKENSLPVSITNPKF